MLLGVRRASRCPLLAASARRSASSKRSDAKMEALTSLYHQCDRYITPENLSDYIDNVFLKHGFPTDDKKMFSQAELFQMKHHQDHSPKFFLGRDEHYPSIYDSHNMGPGWTENKAQRVDRLYKELMGTDKQGRPSWIAVKENARRILSQDDDSHRS
ncbi:hypothetical protein F5I97DRAFT_1864462 [Phlebopus sp. FC_14]|nr:hypothetical protein F5I97DRAFT_1864462 [Phlebopus sp. FC_14]